MFVATLDFQYPNMSERSDLPDINTSITVFYFARVISRRRHFVRDPTTSTVAPHVFVRGLRSLRISHSVCHVSQKVQVLMCTVDMPRLLIASVLLFSVV